MCSKILDAHSHIGMDRFWKHIGSLDEYVRNAERVGITDSLLMSVPCPIITREGCKETLLIWKENAGRYEFYSEYNGIIDRESEHSNPYEFQNRLLSSAISELKTGIRLHYIPIVHPILDKIDYLEKLISRKPIAIKIHGISGGIDPKDIKDDFWRIVFRANIPVIVHVDYDNSDISNSITRLRNKNNPMSWIRILTDKGIRALLTHGIRLSKEAIHIVRNTDQFVVGIGPDSLISKEQERLYQAGDYLSKLIEEVECDKLVFDIDYPWNVREDNLDFDASKRIKHIVKEVEKQEKIFFTNGAKFFLL